MGFIKEINTRLRLKVDTLENWQKSTLGLLEGEIAIATVAASAATGLTEPVVMIKVGQAAEDGVHKTFNELPWNLHAKASDVLAACKSESALTSFIQAAISNEGAYALKEHKHATTDINGLDTAINNRIDAFWLAENDGGKAYVDDQVGQLEADFAEVIGDATDEATADTIYGAIAKALKDSKDYTDSEIQKLDYTDPDYAADTYVSKVTQIDGKIEVTHEALPTYTLTTGDANGQVKFNDTNVDVKGLGSAAYTDATAYDESGTAAAAVNTLKTTYVDVNTDAIAAINNAENGILAQAKEYVDTEDIFTNDTAIVNALGGLKVGDKLNNMTTHEILEALLFPYVAFTINSASRNAAATTLENGATQTLSSATISVTKKSKPITSITLYNGSTVLETKTGDAVANGGSITFNGFDAITVSKSNNPNLKFTVTDGQTSTNKDVGASTFVYPYYWGVCAADATIDEALVEGLTKNVSGKGNKTDIAFTCASQKIVFAYPKDYGKLKSIIDPNNFETIDGYVCRDDISITGLDGTAQAYYVYVLKDACTVTNFKVDFKY